MSNEQNNMEQPKPADTSKLKSILSGAKKVMQESDKRDGGVSRPSSNQGLADTPVQQGMGGGQQTSTPQSPMYENMGGGQQDMQLIQPQQPKRNPNDIISEYEKQRTLDEQERAKKIDNSKMPENVKEAMKKNPVQKPGTSSVTGSFSIDDVKDLVQEEVQQSQQPQPVQHSAPSPNNNSSHVNSSVNEEKVRQIVKDEFINLMMRDDKKTIKKEIRDKLKQEMRNEVIKDLINEGKIRRSKKRKK